MTWWKQILEPLRGLHYKRQYERECVYSLRCKADAQESSDAFWRDRDERKAELDRLKHQIRELERSCSIYRAERDDARVSCVNATLLIEKYKASAAVLRTAFEAIPAGEFPPDVRLTAEELDVAARMQITPQEYLENKGARFERRTAGIQLRNKLVAAKATP